MNLLINLLRLIALLLLLLSAPLVAAWMSLDIWAHKLEGNQRRRRTSASGLIHDERNNY